MTDPVYFVDGTRTPFLRATGARGPFSASDLAVAAGRPLLARHRIQPPELDEVILGCTMPSVDEANIGRVVALRLGCGDRVPGYTVMRNCASAMEALDAAAKDIALGRADLVLAGGTEAMSRGPVLFNDSMVDWLATLARERSPVNKLKALARLRPGYLKPVIGLLHGLTDPVVGVNMGQTCEIVSHRFGITREQMDAYALRSHFAVARAYDEGRMSEVEPLYESGGTVHVEDNGLRRESSMEKLATLKPVFDRRVGLVTAGNSSQVTDGAALLLMASERAVRQRNLPVLGRLVDVEWAALDPAQMGLGPVHAATPLLQRHGLQLNDPDWWEINEAFAGQVLACVAAWADDAYCRGELGHDGRLGARDMDRLYGDGRANAIGHPLGAIRARIVLHALKALAERNGRRAVAAICIGGGQGGAMLLERVH
jgi:acetyl-CoA C-acetyltransferase